MVFYSHMQILSNEKALLVLQTPEENGRVYVYLEKLSALEGAVHLKRSKKLFHIDKIGLGYLIAYDEQKRMLAICGASKVVVKLAV
jgi:hypothetical protein